MYEDLVRAVLKGDNAKFDALLAGDIDVSAVTPRDRWNLLHRTLVGITRAPDPAMIHRLIDLGVDVNARDSYGNTPLHYAARMKNCALMTMLIDAGAQIDPVNHDGLTPLRLTLSSRPYDPRAVECLLARGADPNQRTADAQSVREYAQRIAGSEHEITGLFEKYGAKS